MELSAITAILALLLAVVFLPSLSGCARAGQAPVRATFLQRNIRPRQWVPALAEWLFAVPSASFYPALLCGVRHIRLLVSGEDMSRVAARRVVALVAGIGAFWQWAIGQLVSNAVGGCAPLGAFCLVPNGHLAIARFETVGGPWPARVSTARAVNLRPKGFFERPTDCVGHNGTKNTPFVGEEN